MSKPRKIAIILLVISIVIDLILRFYIVKNGVPECFFIVSKVSFGCTFGALALLIVAYINEIN